jgi:hypothetical protein
MSIKGVELESLRAVRIETEEVLINYLDYKLMFNESSLFLMSHSCNNESFFEINSEFFNETKRIIESLNNNKSFILFINISNSAWKVYNNQESVCLTQAILSRQEFNTPCGKGEIVYGSWKGEAPIKC